MDYKTMNNIPARTIGGFSLVELSIVLVILGLLVSGILTGKALIRASELRSVHADVGQFATAVNSFKDKYFALPGDIPNASQFWGVGVPNGDGDGQIKYLGGAAGEEYNAWQHLGLARLVAGTYTGGITSLPASKLRQGAYRISYQTNVYGRSATMISLNATQGATALVNKAILGPDEVMSMDMKVDDGLADKGTVMGFNEEGVPGCVTNDYTAGSGSYIPTSTAVKCKIFFKLQ